jgi:hypothetical protein
MFIRFAANCNKNEEKKNRNVIFDENFDSNLFVK